MRNKTRKWLIIRAKNNLRRIQREAPFDLYTPYSVSWWAYRIYMEDYYRLGKGIRE